MKSIIVIIGCLSTLMAFSESHLTPNARAKIAKDRAMRMRKDQGSLFTKEEIEAQQRDSESIKSKEIGTFGYFGSPVKIIQIVSPSKCLIKFGWHEIGRDYEYNAILDNVSTTKWVDGDCFVFNQKFIISGTESYTTVLGAKRTVLKITVYHPPEATNEVSDLRASE